MPTTLRAVYLAGPIDFDRDPASWRLTAARVLADSGIACFNPVAAFQPAPGVSAPAAAYVSAVNLAALACSHAVLVHAEPSLGTGYELAQAERLGLPIFAFGPKARRSFALAALGNAGCFDTLEEAMTALVAISCHPSANLRAGCGFQREGAS